MRAGRWIVGLGLIGLAALGIAIARSQRLPEGPQPVVWDKDVCARCRMHIGEPWFAAQLQTGDGKVLNFDDPGCLLAYLDETRPDVHAVWFHHVKEDRWIPWESVAFTETGSSPMGFGLGAVDAGTPGSIGLEEARRRVAQGAETSP